MRFKSQNSRSREVANAFPDPLHSSGGWSDIGAWAPPAAALSFASACVGVLALWFLQRSADLRALFSLALTDDPLYNRGIAIALGLIATTLAWVIVIRCRERPGPAWPRLWALSLALLTSSVATIQCLGPPPNQAPFINAMDIACLASALALAPRLLRLHPDSPWMQRVAPSSLLFVLLALLPPLYLIGGDVVLVWRRGLEGAVSNLQAYHEDLKRCAEAPRGCSQQEYGSAFSSLANVVGNPAFRDIPARLSHDNDLMKLQGKLESAQAALLGDLASDLPGRLEQQLTASSAVGPDPQTAIDDFKALWQLAAQTGKTEATRPAYGRLLDVLIASAPPLLRESPAVYTAAANNGPWEKNRAFEEASRQTANHAMKLKALLTQMGNFAEASDTPNTPGAKQLRETFLQKYHGGWEKRLQSIETSWAEHWLLPYFSDQPLEADTPLPWPPLPKVLRMPVIGELAAADISGLLNLTKPEAERLVDEGKAGNCEKKQRDDKTLSLHCRAYVATTRDRVELRAELRLIYELRRNVAKPDRLFLLLPVPQGTNLESFAYEIENTLPEAGQAMQRLLQAVDTRKDAPENQDEGGWQMESLCPPKSGNACAEAWDYVKGPQQQYIKLVVYR